jgi:YidC/Oxa1 family membrane protein insertase
MISSIWNTAIYEPLYNILILIIDSLPGHSVGVAIILLTIFVKIVLFPLTAKSIRAQRAMKELEPELKVLKERHGDDRQKLAQETMALYQKRGVTPFSGCLPLLIQIPVIIGLYWVFSQGLKSVDKDILYSFVSIPESLDMHFLVFDLAGKSIFLALLAGVTQFIQTHISLGKQAPLPAPDPDKKPSFQEDFARSMQVQMRYVLPVIVGGISMTLPAAVALYWAISNILSTGQELITKKAVNNESVKS